MKKYIVTLFAAALILGSSQVARADIVSGLTGYWNFDEGSGTTAADSSGSGNTLSLTNGASWTTGEIGASAETLDGSSQYARLPASAFGSYPLSGASNSYSVTFSTWFKTTSAGVILGQDAAVDPPSTVGGYVPGIYIDAAGKIRASIFWHGSTASQIVTSGSYNDGAWHQVVDTYAAGTETLYVDGASAGTQSVIESGYSSAYYFFLGTGFANAWPGINSGWAYFNGSLDDTRIYSRALTSADAAELYAYTGSQTVKQGGGRSQAGGTGGTSDLTGWAWSSNIGWISFNSNDNNTGASGSGKSTIPYKVSVSTTTGSTVATFSGYAWSSSLGWISFQPDDITGCAGPAVSAVVDSSGNLTGQITGFVRVLSEQGAQGVADGWDGCARLGDVSDANQLSPTPDANTFTGSDGHAYLKGGVTYSRAAQFFKGFAWANTVLGWLDFENPFSTSVSVCSAGCCQGDSCPSQSSLTLTASQGSTVGVTAITVAPGSVTTLNWAISNLTNCGTVESDWSKVSGTASIAANTTGSGNISFTTGDAGTSHILTISCDVPASSPKSSSVTITVSSGTVNPPGNPNTCPMPANSSLCPGSDQNGTQSNVYNSCPSVVASCQFVCDVAHGYTVHGGSCTKSGEQEL